MPEMYTTAPPTRRKFTIKAFGPGLVIGIGNAGRSDDGLGWAFLDALRERGFPESRLVYRYQLQVEDAELSSRYERVLFVDSTKEVLDKGYAISEVVPQVNPQFSTHALDPGTIIGLCSELYDDVPVAVVLSISGEKWDLDVGLSTFGEQNLRQVLAAVA